MTTPKSTITFCVWSLERYARMTSPNMTNDMPSSDQWEYFDNSTEKLELTLTSSDQILIHSGKRLLESISLAEAKVSMRGICKGDSVLIIFKLKEETRRFRMKFDAKGHQRAEDTCRDCVGRLSRFFPLKISPIPTITQEGHGTGSQSRPPPTKTLQGEVTLSQLAQTMDKSHELLLPSTYTGCAEMSAAGINTMLKLCLTDSRFPAFVEQVEQELERIKRESA